MRVAYFNSNLFEGYISKIPKSYDLEDSIDENSFYISEFIEDAIDVANVNEYQLELIKIAHPQLKHAKISFYNVELITPTWAQSTIHHLELRFIRQVIFRD